MLKKNLSIHKVPIFIIKWTIIPINIICLYYFLFINRFTYACIHKRKIRKKYIQLNWEGIDHFYYLYMIPHIHSFLFYATCHFHPPTLRYFFLSCLYKTYLFIVEQIFILLKRKHESMEGVERRKKNGLMKF